MKQTIVRYKINNWLIWNKRQVNMKQTAGRYDTKTFRIKIISLLGEHCNFGLPEPVQVRNQIKADYNQFQSYKPIPFNLNADYRRVMFSR